MKSKLQLILLSASIFFCACSPSKTSDTDDQELKEFKVITAEPSPSSNPNFISSEELSLQGINFKISATNKQPTNSISVTTEGLEVSNEPQLIEISGGLVNAEVEDMNSDGSPELILILESYDANSEEFAIGFSVNNLKSMSRVAIPPLSEEQKVGYQGGGEMALVETKLVRRFPVYEFQGDKWIKTDKTRQLQYSLKEGEAMRQFVLDKTTEF